MPFQVSDQVVYPALGVGWIAGIVRKSFSAALTEPYYEVVGERSTVWVPVEEASARGLRRLTRLDELAHFRGVLRSRPIALNADFRQRQLYLRSQLRRGTLQNLCEVVRDLSGRAWHEPLNEADSGALQQGREALAQEWAAADGVSIREATVEIDALLLEARPSDGA